MNYQFPTIKHIADVLPAIKDKPEFIVVTKPEGYTVINYAYASGDTFGIPNPATPEQLEAAYMQMECRGLIFETSTGKLLRRAFHKFFNLGEKGWTRDVDFSKPYDIELKLDGSMITPIWLPTGTRLNGETINEVHLTTKMGITDVSLKATEYYKDCGEHKYHTFFAYCEINGWTPILEWLDSKTPIVIKHRNDSLVLLAVRDKASGEYISKNIINEAIIKYHIPTCPKVPFDIDLIKDIQDIEGIVIVFNNGHRIKVKTDWYVGMHRFKDETSSLRKLIKLILEERIDDTLTILPEMERQEVESKVNKFWNWFNLQVQALELINLQHTSKFSTKKELALHLQQAKTPRWLNAIYYRTYEGDDVSESFKKMILSNCNQESVFNEFNEKELQICLS